MDKLSTDYLELYDAAKKELQGSVLKEGEMRLIQLTRFPAIRGCWFSIELIQKRDGSLISRFSMWDRIFDLDRWRLGIYHLNRLRILSDEMELEESEKRTFESLISRLNFPLVFDSPQGFVLDGCPSQIQFNLPTYVGTIEWSYPSPEWDGFDALVQWLEGRHDVNKCDKYLK
jgi:hypothetical protein